MARDTRPSDGHFSDIKKRRMHLRRRQLRRAWLQIMLCGASLTASPSAYADVPTGGNVVAGAATFLPSANALDINATTSRSIIDWNSFNVGAGHTVSFNLPDSSSAILNRVTTPNMPSAIHGMLQSNGHVYLVNPSGIVVGAGGTVNTNAFVASTFDITNQNFLSGGALAFNDNGSAASIVNHGTINTGAGGAHLIAGSITNNGTITSTGGNITLSGGGTVTLDNGVTYVQPRLDVLAGGISPTAGLIQNSGAIRATGAATSGGEVYLINPSGTILHDGTIAVTKPAPTSFANDPEPAPTIGGHVQFEADQITLASDSRIDATGTHGGGSVLIGGDWQGSGPMHQAIQVTMEAGARIDASAITSGDGGKIVLWSDIWNNESITEVFGTLLATGGDLSGDGGQIETSGHLLQINAEAHASTRAANGKTGQWLLDPIDFTISAGTAPQTTSGIGATTLVSALANNNITIQTDSATSGLGNLLVNADVLSDSDTSLTLFAHNDLLLASNIRSGGGIVLKANNDIVASGNVSLTTDGGDVVIASNADSIGYGGFTALADMAIHTGGGNILIGGGPDAVGFAQGGETAQAYQHGIRFSGNADLRSDGGDIALRGRSGTTSATSNTAWGIGFANNVLIDSGAGSILMHGVGQNTTSGAFSHGVSLGGTGGTTIADVQITSAGAQLTAIEIIADAAASSVANNNDSRGIAAWSNATRVTANGLGAIRFIGTARNQQTDAVMIQGGDLLASSGPIDLQATNGRINVGQNALTLGAKSGTNVASSSSNIQLRSDVLSVGTNLLLNTTGVVTVEPMGASFQAPLIWQTNTSNPARTIGGLSLGKAGNTSRIDVTAAQTVHGDIDIQAGQIVISSPLFAHGDININADTGTQLAFNGIGVVITAGISTSAESDGNIAISGRGGNASSGSQYGAFVNGALEIAAGGGGKIDIHGVGGASTAATNYGTLILAPTNSTLVRINTGGALVITGTAGGIGNFTGDNDGLLLLNFIVGKNTGGSVSLTGISGTQGSSFSGWASESIAFIRGGSGTILAGLDRTITLTGDEFFLDPLIRIGNTSGQSGALVFQPYSNRFRNVIDWRFSALQLAGISGLTIGKPGNTSNITINASQSVSGNISLYGGTVVLNGILATAPTGRVLINANGNVSSGGGGYITSGGLEIARANSVTLDHSLNRVDSLAINGAAIRYTNSGPLQIGTVGQTSGIQSNGTVHVSTTQGDIVVAAPIATTSNSTSAIILNAGRTQGVGVMTGGSIRVQNGATIAAGPTGRATLFTGSVSDSLGLAELFGLGSGRFRYNSNESLTNYSLGLGIGLFGIFRERPTVNVLANVVSIVYGMTQPTLGSITGVNGDKANQIFSTVPTFSLVAPVSSSGHFAVGEYIINVQSGVQRLGYAINNSGPGHLAVAPRTITVSGISVADKIYDATTIANVTTSNAEFIGAIDGDSLSILSIGAFLDKHVGSDKSVSLTNVFGGDDVGNYLITDQAMTTATIAARPVTVSGITAFDKVYDGSVSAFINSSASEIVGVIAGDDLTVTSQGEFADKNVGNAKQVTISNIFAGADVSNYQITNQLTTAANITARPITSSGITANDKVYDGTTTALVDLSGLSFSGIIAGDDLSVSSQGLFSDKHAATGKQVLLTQTLGGSDLGNYLITGQSSTTASITPRPITISGISALNRVYDGTTSAVIDSSSRAIVGMIAGDDLTVSSQGAFADKHVGTGKQILLSHLFGGIDRGNYLIIDQASTWANITARPITISGITALDKIYDGTGAALIDSSNVDIVGLIAGDDLSVSSQGAFSDKHVGTAKQVLLNHTFSGADGGNYQTFDQSTTTANITARPITVIGITANDKVYDGTTAVTIDAGTATFGGMIAGDNLSVVSIGAFADKNVGTVKSINLANVFGGTDLGNYLITDQLVAYANIDPRELVVSGIAAINKIYDATTSAAFDTSNVLLSGLVAGDDLAIESAIGTFADKHVGTNKSVAISSTFTGNDAGNYAIVNQSTATANIAAAPLSIVGIGVIDKVYDGTVGATVTGSPAVSPLVGDSVVVSGSAAATFADKNSGTNKSVSVGGFTLSGPDAGNYQLQFPSDLAAAITPAPLFITANHDSKWVTLQDANSYAGVTYTGFIPGEDESVLTGSLAITRAIAGESAGEYLDALLPSGLTAQNYDIQFVTGDFTIRPADSLRIRFADSSSVYGNAPLFGPVIAEYLAGDQVFHTLQSAFTSDNRYTLLDAVGGQTEVSIVPLSPAFSGSAALRVGSYLLGASALPTANDNFSSQLTVIGSHSVTPAPINVFAGGLAKVYDGTRSIPDLTLASSGSLAGDAVNVTGSGQLLTRHAGNGLGYQLTDLALWGPDAGNYTLATGSTLLGTGGVITPKPITLTAPIVERFFNRGVDVAPTRDHLSALSTQLGVAGDSMQSIQLRFDSPEIGIDKTLTPSMAIISDGNSGRNYALSYAPNHTSRIIELPAGVLSSFETKLQTTNRQSVTDTNTRYTASSPTVHAPIDFVKPIPAVGNSIQFAGTVSGPAVSVLVTEGVTEGSGETFIGKAEKEGGD